MIPIIIYANRKIEDSIISTTLSIGEFGNNTYTAEEEKAVLKDYKIEIDYGSLDFSRYIYIDNHMNPYVLDNNVQNDTSNADLVTLRMPMEIHKITEDMELTYAVDVSKLNNSFEGYKNIVDNICLGKAMIAVFESVIVDCIKQKLEISMMHKDNFEDTISYIIN